MRRPRSRLVLIPLEDRTVPAAVTANLSDGILRIFGTDGPDAIMLRYANSNYTIDSVTGVFAASGVQSLQVLGYGGNDSIDLRVARVPVAVDAGAGYDAVVGGIANDSIVGGVGDDLIWGGSGDDAIDGGAGSDRLFGDSGNDILIGGAGTNAIDGGSGTNVIVDGTITPTPTPTPSPTPTPKTPVNDYYSHMFADATVQTLARTYAADNWLDRSEMLAIYSQVSTDGTVSAAELNDLDRLVRPNWVNVPSSQQYGMADSVRVLGLMVAEGDRANATFQGTSLGNLQAGSSGTVLQKLVAKWFLGQDHPTASGTYRAVSGSLFVNGPSYRDVDQGASGDCYLVAALGEMAQLNPDSIRQAFTDNGDGTFTIRFFRDGSARYVTVDRYLPVNSLSRVVYAGVGGARYDSSANELWVALAEKAYAQLNQSGWSGHDGTNSYAGIEGGWSDDVFKQVLGGSAGWVWASKANTQTLATLAIANTPTVLGSKSSGTSSGVVGDHAYGLVGFNSVTAKYTLYNPWGSTLELTWSQIVANFNGYWYAG
ncbi:MAG: C2 family cysteine protease [Gemmataceae bacterium]